MAAVRGHQYFSLRWNNYQNTMTSVFQQLREDLSFVDVTLSCEHGSLKAHKVSIYKVFHLFIINSFCYFFSGCLVRLLDVFPKTSPREPMQTSHHHLARRHHLHRPENHHWFCLSWGNRRYRIGITGKSMLGVYLVIILSCKMGNIGKEQFSICRTNNKD